MPASSLRTVACNLVNIERLQRQTGRALHVVVAIEAVTGERVALLGRELLP